METIYQLKPNLIWHDGTSLEAQDFVFAWQVYTTPVLAAADPVPQLLMDQISAFDAQTLMIRWRQTFPDAGAVDARAFQALPRHLLEQPFRAAQASLNYDAFTGLPFWRAEYVGLGPYRIDRWEPGAFLEASAFDAYVRGKPKIPRIKVIPVSDPNVVVAGLLAEEIHLAVANSLPFTQGIILKSQWAAQSSGGVVMKNRPSPSSPVRRTEHQMSPERVAPGSRALLDVRVRRALAHAVDKDTLNTGLFNGEAVLSDTPVPPHVDYFAAVERAISKYPFDLRRAEQLMNEAGYSKGTDGNYTSATSGRFTPEIGVIVGPQNEAVMNTMVAGWHTAGFAFTEFVLPAAQAQDGQARASFTSMFTTDGGNLPILGTAYIPSPENRWNGNNRSNWSNATYDRLVDQWNTTLDRNERNGRMVEMARVYSEDIPSTPLYYNIGATAHVAGLRGPANEAEDIELWDFSG
jgi:peptide/nickel transport system substrate-binding protein